MTDLTTTNTPMWHETNEGKNAFWDTVFSIACERGLVTGIGQDRPSWENNELRHVVLAWGESLTNFLTLDGALNDFREYAAVGLPAINYLSGGGTVNVEITRNYGSVSITLGMERFVEITSNAQRAAVVDVLTHTLIEEHKRVLSNLQLPANTPGATGGNAQANPNQTTQVEIITSITHEFVDGKHRAKVKTPSWTKWGVPVYDEVLQTVGFDNVEALPLGEMKWEGMATVLIVNGKPVKVVKLEAKKA